MKLVRPSLIDDAALISSSVPEDEPVYDHTHTYAEDDQVRGTGADAHTLFQSLQDANDDHPLTDADWWVRVGATNQRAMFDGVVQNPTTAADLIDVVVQPKGRIDVVGLFTLNASTVRVTQTDIVDGVVFDKTFTLVSSSGIVDWYDWLFEPVERADKLIVTGLKAYTNSAVEVDLAWAGQQVACGELVVGFSKHIGDTQWGAQVGITSFSTKLVDAFGNVRITPRAFIDIASFNINVEPTYVDQLKRQLEQYRDIPILYIGDDDYAATAVYGYFKSFNEVIAGPPLSLCALDVEGLA